MNKANRWPIIAALSFLVLLIVLIAPFCIYHKIFNGAYSNDSNEWSNFGSFYGGLVSPFLAFFSTILLLITILLQKRSTDIQESENEKYLIKVQNEIDNNSLQIETLVRQRFETTLNEMISHKFSVVDSFAINKVSGDQIVSGTIIRLIRNDNEALGNNGFEFTTEVSKKEKGKEIFSTLIGLLNYIVSVGIYIENNAPLDKDHYFSIFRHSLNDSELKLLVFTKGKKDLSENYYRIINKILGDYSSISISDIESVENRNIHMIASSKGIINLI